VHPYQALTLPSNQRKLDALDGLAKLAGVAESAASASPSPS
jgi:hypothetical protein